MERLEAREDEVRPLQSPSHGIGHWHLLHRLVEYAGMELSAKSKCPSFSYALKVAPVAKKFIIFALAINHENNENDFFIGFVAGDGAFGFV